MAIHLRVVYGCFHDTAEWRCCNRDHMACKPKHTYCLALCRQNVLTTDLDKERSQCVMWKLLVFQDALYKSMLWSTIFGKCTNLISPLETSQTPSPYCSSPCPCCAHMHCTFCLLYAPVALALGSCSVICCLFLLTQGAGQAGSTGESITLKADINQR